ncbi:hypothetical protein [Lentzea flaviverrucosa]|uniref:Uncharacterized protein n=1 Tax=Lentzea flaviverrucosa TaxID=200379 RepID=A0A1H9XWM7_9PSEU|nr:hypothetical protein [Lentzea flaviverrucosa]RDI34259.1 hypothetical protein DFR72_1016 [Lentzea flaviverrucosa]SES50570.1 hypothetical protein SAMN05216195_120201 [Lentzea flaviverrucosa]
MKRLVVVSLCLLAAVPLSRRAFVYALRRGVDAPTLRSASSRDLARIGVENGLVNEQSAANVKLGTFTVSGDTASAEVLEGGAKVAGLHQPVGS